MKVFLKLITILTFISTVYPIKAQESNLINSSENKLKSIIKFEFAIGGIQFENKSYKKSSFNFTLQYRFAGLADKDKYDFQITPEYRFYLSK